MAVTRLTTNGLTGTKYDIASADNYYMEPIATQLLGSAQATITFSNIPQGYKHLQIRYIARSSHTGQDGFKIQLNGVTTSLYSYHYLGGNGSAVYSGASANATFMQGTSFAGSDAATNVFGSGILDVLDYASSIKNKTLRSLGGFDSNGAGVSEMWSGSSYITSPITSITLFSFNAKNITTNSRFSLYGIKG
jgi:hypothetical protein